MTAVRRVFVSCRREDCGARARLLELTRAGDDMHELFRDVQDIGLGEDLRRRHRAGDRASRRRARPDRTSLAVRHGRAQERGPVAAAPSAHLLGRPSPDLVDVVEGSVADLQQALTGTEHLYATLASLGPRDDPDVRTEPRSSAQRVDEVRQAELVVDVLPDHVADVLYGESERPAARTSWTVDGVQYAARSAADRALDRSLGSCSRDQRVAAPRAHGLRSRRPCSGTSRHVPATRTHCEQP